MRVAINLLTEDVRNPSGAHWFWTRVIPEMSKRLESDEELYLLVSPSSRPSYEGYGGNVRYIMFPWSNERRTLRTLSEHLYAPLRLPWTRIDVLNTLMAPIVNPNWALVIHMKTMHAFTAPESMTVPARVYRRLNYPRTARLADAIIVNSRSMQADVERYLHVGPEKLRLIYEAVDHELFRPGNREEAREHVAVFGVTQPFVLFVSSLWRYKNCDGLLRAWAIVRADLPGHQLVIVGPRRDAEYANELDTLVTELGIARDVVFVGGVPLEETAWFYQAADSLVYPSFTETFGLPILEAMACGCPVVTSDLSAMPEIAGGAALVVDPRDPIAIAAAISEACGPRSEDLRQRGLQRAGEFNWGATAEATLDVYREVARCRRDRRR
jgi:glycosyltransferase involved in cell wall biosynthesis